MFFLMKDRVALKTEATPKPYMHSARSSYNASQFKPCMTNLKYNMGEKKGTFVLSWLHLAQYHIPGPAGKTHSVSSERMANSIKKLIF